MTIITDDDVQRLLSMEECIEAMRVAFSDFAKGGVVNYRKAMAQGVGKSIPKAWLGSNLSSLYAAGYRPSP